MFEAKLFTGTDSSVDSHIVIPIALITVKNPTPRGSTPATNEPKTTSKTIPTIGATHNSELIKSSFNRTSKVVSTAKGPVIHISKSGFSSIDPVIVFQCSIMKDLASVLG